MRTQTLRHSLSAIRAQVTGTSVCSENFSESGIYEMIPSPLGVLSQRTAVAIEHMASISENETILHNVSGYYICIVSLCIVDQYRITIWLLDRYTSITWKIRGGRYWANFLRSGIFLCFSVSQKYMLVSCRISRSYLTGVAAAQLRWHQSSMNMMQRI